MKRLFAISTFALLALCVQAEDRPMVKKTSPAVQTKYPVTAATELDLPSFFSDGMVMQRNADLFVWGRAVPNSTVTVTFNSQTLTAVSSSPVGDWQVIFPPMKAGGPYVMTVISRSSTITVSDIYIGEVWFCSGQSNMARGMKDFANTNSMLSKMNYPKIHLFRAKDGTTNQKTTAMFDVISDDGWQVCTPVSSTKFSATGLLFGIEIFNKLKEIEQTDVHVGLIHSAIVGTAIERWMRPGSFSKTVTGDLYNGLIAPFQPFSIAGVIWYQGEADSREDAANNTMYDKYLSSMIQDWRKYWGQLDMPFIYVQLPRYTGAENPSINYQFDMIRECQRKALSVSNTAMAIIIDTGDIDALHPQTKEIVAKRLALPAYALAYGQDIEYSGPIFKKAGRNGNKIVIHFDHTGSGLKSMDGLALNNFEISGPDGIFVDATAQIADDTVVVFNNAVSNPTKVRYAYAKAPVPAPNLANVEGLPASPFTADLENIYDNQSITGN